MHPYIDLCVRYKKSPDVHKSPPLAGGAQGKEYELSQGKVIAGVGRGKAGARRTIADEDPDGVGYGRILAGAIPEYILLDQVATDQVADDSGQDQVQSPPPASLFEVHRDKYQEEQVKRNPQFRLPQEEGDPVKK